MSDIISQGWDTIHATGNALSYIVANCTRWVAENAPWIPAGWGDAKDWFGNAQNSGFQTIGPTLTPPIGSVAVWGGGLPGSHGHGHVALVTGANAGGGFQVSEENFLGSGRTDTRNVTDTGNLLGFILAPGQAAGQAVANATGIPQALKQATNDATTFATRALWIFLAVLLVVFGLFLLIAQEIGHAVKNHPEALEAAAL